MDEKLLPLFRLRVKLFDSEITIDSLQQYLEYLAELYADEIVEIEGSGVILVPFDIQTSEGCAAVMKADFYGWLRQDMSIVEDGFEAGSLAEFRFPSGAYSRDAFDRVYHPQRDRFTGR